MGRWLNGELLAAGELAEPLAALDGLPLRPRTLFDFARGTVTLAESSGLPSALDAASPSGQVCIDPGWILLQSATRWSHEPFAPADHPWWSSAVPEPVREARNRLWRHAVASSIAVHLLGHSLEPDSRRQLAQAALLHRLDLWALAALSPDRLTSWLDAPGSSARAALELAWFGSTWPRNARSLALGWGVDPVLLELLDRAARSPDSDDPPPDWWTTWKQATRLVWSSRWALDAPSAGTLPYSLPARERRLIDVSVQLLCADGLDSPRAQPDLEQATRDHARTRIELLQTRRALRRFQQDGPDDPPSPPDPPHSPATLDQLAEFAAGAAHEINNPLAVVVGRAQLLMAKAADPDTRRSLQAILQQARRANQILRDLMYIARPPEPRYRPCSPEGILRSAVADHQTEASERGLALSLSIEGAASVRQSDPDALRHLADILLRNALEATPRGGSIHVRSQASPSGISWRVDTPDARITDEQVRHLFNPFFCGRQAGRGLGLGLPRAARWIHSVGGTLRFRRGRHGGTSFRIFLPDPSPCRH